MLEEVLLVLASAVVVVSYQKCRHDLTPQVTWTMDCRGMGLSSVPRSFNFHPVVTIDLSHNLLVRLEDSQFENWTTATHLDLSSNSITAIDRDVFKGLNSLTELNLEDNHLEIISSNITNYLPKLNILKLSSNRITKIYPGSFKPVQFLLKLMLNNNPDLGKVTNNNPDFQKDSNNYDDLVVTFNQSLLSLDVSNCSISEIPDSFFANSNLIFLNVTHNPIRNIPLLPPSLRYLNISGTLVESVPQDTFLKSDSLEKLYLQDMPLFLDISARSLNGLSQLKDLIVKDCPKLRFISEAAFGEVSPKLRKLVLSNCSLTALPQGLSSLLDKAVYLDLQYNPWVCDGGLAWVTTLAIPLNLTENLRCDQPSPARGQRLHDYFTPHSLHHHWTLVQGGLVIVMVAVFVTSVVAMIRHMTKPPVKVYRQLQDIALQDRTPSAL